VASFHPNTDYGHPSGGVPARLATALRVKLTLKADPIRCLQQDVLDPLGIVVLWTPLPATVDAVAMASEETGAVIIANPQGAHMRTAFQRRVTLAHEVCHILYDRPEMARFVRACRVEGEPTGTVRDWFERVERRARAFSVALLAPPDALRARWDATANRPNAERIGDVMSWFGLGYEATRSHLHNQKLFRLDERVDGAFAALSTPWEGEDPAPGIERTTLRGGVLRDLCLEAVEAGLVSTRWAEERVRGPLAPPRAWRSEDSVGLGYVTTSMGA
jgi:Zn-dependent peptidase ImmA (M78 family)